MSWLQFNLTELVDLSRPPDPELVDLIELGFLEGQIDGRQAEAAYYWLLAVYITSAIN